MNDITVKQLEFISIIEDVLGIPFKGLTKWEASEYISENIDEFKRVSAINAELDFMVEHPKFS